ncbi:MAG: 6,7-dimethyl-8-ribityllumazine synthase [Liquorilactobacillus nagelii]|uniref:6,7-dimethyl-8-ribityllumazine synthase n=1 Tax=Liquorilactobacillus nagelii TaxID=82688 RepID=UPI0006F0B65D|nr:6,7-dimethyl-8-ribityllumazine synthase [Liquorilactobacillus nagelii]KRL42396.1 6,7-dimethyl-8-ribityllumazine synthase [Liquorilactobacillus nagelii DSM 13675]QYH53249.1 6,7-dimethyl-8-ribityllumazine synthase [Liquorilactobacillus nagelii DSM 13675]
MKEYVGNYDGEKQRIGIVIAKFNDLVTKRLLEGARQTLFQAGVTAENIEVYWVPGAFEIPRTARLLSESGRVKGIIALGAVVRGETAHFDYVCAAAANGIAEISLQGAVPVMFGVLTTDTMDQALNRAGGKAGNKGSECALALLEMVSLQQQIQKI